MNSVKDLVKVISEDIEELAPEAGFESRMLHEARIRRLRAAEAARTGTRPFGTPPIRRASDARSNEPPRLIAFVAVLLALAIVVSLVVVAHTLNTRSTIPAYQGPRVMTQPGPIHFSRCAIDCAVATQSPLAPKQPVAQQCVINNADVCEVKTPFFSSPTVGWMATILMPDGPSTLYRTDDGAQHWRPVLSWDGSWRGNFGYVPPVGRGIVSSADGNEVLVLAGTGGAGISTIFHSTDGGSHWQANGFPTGLGSMPIVQFVSAHEGWAEGTGLLHTTDAGAHWVRVGVFDSGPGGKLFFFASSIGVYTESGAIYVSHDDGTMWQEVTPPRPSALPASAKYFNIQPRFFDDRLGVLVVYYCSKQGCTSADLNFAYTTLDGGSHWSTPVRLPTSFASASFIDINDWFGMTFAFVPTGAYVDTRIGSLIRTTDAGHHWQVLASASPGGSLAGWNLSSPVDFTDPLHGWATTQGQSGDHGVVSLRLTSDGGATWTDRSIPASSVEAT